MCFGAAKAASFSNRKGIYTMKIFTEEDKKRALEIALTNTQGAKLRWEQRAKTGLNDKDMAKAVRYEIGIAGGSGGRGDMKTHYEGAGLKVWGSWQVFRPCMEEPLFQGDATIKAARLLFGVKDPNDRQLSLF